MVGATRQQGVERYPRERTLCACGRTHPGSSSPQASYSSTGSYGRGKRHGIVLAAGTGSRSRINGSGKEVTMNRLASALVAVLAVIAVISSGCARSDTQAGEAPTPTEAIRGASLTPAGQLSPGVERGGRATDLHLDTDPRT